MIVLKRFYGEHFQLLKDQLRQVPPTYGYKWRAVWRAVRRADLAKLFRAEGKIRAEHLNAYFSDGDEFERHWLTVYDGRTLAIGCQYFDAEETTKIRRWALRK